MKKPWKVLVLAICLSFVLPLVLAACGGGDNAIVGSWTDQDGFIEYEFKSADVLVVRFMGEEEQTTYSAKDGKLSFPNPDTGEQDEIDYRIDGDNLIMNVGGEEGTLVRKK